MFKLKKVELLGFKSFADRTRLEFPDGTVAIVGPNGCGKSNLSDAISWVLGEQSARSLRGERMADVIFNGTGARPATGMAEVSLTLVDPEYVEAAPAKAEPAKAPAESSATPEASAAVEEESQAPEETETSKPPRSPAHRPGEIVVTRRLFRSGESEYLINSEICRLRDIQDLFMGTGLGPESYAIIEQGRIGQILSSKPIDRRLIIEEAAGVSKFKTRKRLAEAKLESSRQNLARITDILEEVTKQVNSLKRQASKARRHREILEELRGQQKLVLASRLRSLEEECRRLREELARLTEEGATTERELEALEREEKQATLRHEALENPLTQARERLAQNDLERQRVESGLEQLRQQRSGLDERIREAGRESERLLAQLESLEQEAHELNRRAERLRNEQKAACEAVERCTREKQEFAAQVATNEKDIESSREALLEAVSKAAELRNQLIQAEETKLALERQLARTHGEKKAAEGELDRRETELKEWDLENQKSGSALRELSVVVSTITARLEALRAEEVACRNRVESLRQEFSAAHARRQALEESLARHTYTNESVRRLLAENRSSNGHSFRPLGLLADFVEVSPGYEDVVEEFLKHDLECVVVEGHEEARSGIALLKSEGSGRSTFFVTRIPSNGHTNGHGHPELRQAKGVVAPVRDLVRFEPRLELNGDAVLPAIENAYVVENAPAAERLAVEYPDCHFLTREGEHYHHRLVSGGSETSAGPLSLRRDLREIERSAGKLEAQVREAESALEETGRQIARLEEELQRHSAEKSEAEKKTVLTGEKLRQTREMCQREAERCRVLSEEAAALEGESKALEGRQSSLRKELEASVAEETERQAAVAEKTEALREARVRLDELTQHLATVQAQGSTLEERAHSLDAEKSRLEAQSQDLRSRQARLEEQKVSWREEQERLKNEGREFQSRLNTLGTERQAGELELETLTQESQALRARRDKLSPSIESARALFDARREKRSETEVALARAESDEQHQAGQCRDELHLDPARLFEEVPREQTLAAEALQAAEERLRELKERLENLGPVNMMALEELQESEERYQFLETQRQDLLASIEDTSQAIREIDEVSRRQFLEAFAAINGYFAETFRTLFGGGVGEMRLSDEADPESGLDIVAQPPGKRLQNVLLLSGGEKALAALALLIAVFRFTPSPFCILDEVDAPLDESNIDRFTRLIRNMSRHTQFILVTHNKRTMEIARALYGVTMEEPGVSKMVSVRFDQVEKEPAAVPV